MKLLVGVTVGLVEEFASKRSLKIMILKKRRMKIGKKVKARVKVGAKAPAKVEKSRRKTAVTAHPKRIRCLL